MPALQLIDPEIGLTIVHWGGWALFWSGVLHLLVWVVGEFRPSIYRNFKIKIIRQLLTGISNRFMFGVGGVFLVISGGICVILGKLLAYFFSLP